jgi:hypothetical protein
MLKYGSKMLLNDAARPRRYGRALPDLKQVLAAIPKS